jgi:uncharacterized protein
MFKMPPKFYEIRYLLVTRGTKFLQMIYFVYKLNPPRPTFAQDMTESESKIMQEHAAYWRNLADKGIVIIFGPVLDPKGPWGLAVVEGNDESEVRIIVSKDPAIKSGIGFKSEVYPMLQAVLRKSDLFKKS